MLQNKFNSQDFLQNVSNACALAEWKFGAGKGCKNMIFLTFGTGMGAGLILDGRLYSGTNDMAGEVGHVRIAEDGFAGYGKAGSFEGFCSGGGIAQYGFGSAKDVAAKESKVI
jgi:glucokinase